MYYIVTRRVAQHCLYCLPCQSSGLHLDSDKTSGLDSPFFLFLFWGKHTLRLKLPSKVSQDLSARFGNLILHNAMVPMSVKSYS